MPSALSADLRERVVAAIEQGASRRQAAKRFSVSLATAIRWHESFAQQGRLAPKPQGGDQRSHRIEAHAALILQTYETRPQIFLRELRDALQEHRVEVSTSSLSRFFARHRISRKKGRRTRLSRSGGRKGCPRGLVCRPARPRSGPAGVPGRDRRNNQHGSPVRLGPAR
jgi:transposase